jgi:hypothetical protein
MSLASVLVLFSFAARSAGGEKLSPKRAGMLSRGRVSDTDLNKMLPLIFLENTTEDW